MSQYYGIPLPAYRQVHFGSEIRIFHEPQLGHLFTLVHGIILCAGRKNITQIQQATKVNRHLSSTTKRLEFKSKNDLALEMIEAAVKTNRRIRPAGISIPMDEFAVQYIQLPSSRFYGHIWHFRLNLLKIFSMRAFSSTND